MKKCIHFLLIILALSLVFACKPKASSETTSESLSASESQVHVHDIVKIAYKESTCKQEGNVEFYYCKRCKKYYQEESATNEITLEQTKLKKAKHQVQKVDGKEPTCSEYGEKERWVCSVCSNSFADEECFVPLVGSDLQIAMLPHELTYVAEVQSSSIENGYKEHWECEKCNDWFLDDKGENKVNKEELVIYTLNKLPDFIVDIEHSNDPIVLQLTDTQIIDGSQSRPDASSGDKITYAPEKYPIYVYNYITEIVNAVNPDFIIITGDLIYGKYDDNGSLLKSFINFMESFKIPWAPVFGNHENESKMGSDWQSAQLENANYCMFKQRTLTGNGNYTVALRQNGVFTRMFYMLDSNGCSDASTESMSNGHTSKSVGFGEDQIEWYTKHIGILKQLSPSTKISFAFHIQLSVFADALSKYGFDQNQKYHDIFIDYLTNKESTDFGYVGRQMKDGWDSSKRVFNGMKALGVDSIFVGHEHCNSASVTYEGVRLQYGQKSSEYDRYNCLGLSGKIMATAIYETVEGKTPVVGGSVIVLSKTDGAIKDAYIYYCKINGENVDFDKYYKK